MNLSHAAGMLRRRRRWTPQLDAPIWHHTDLEDRMPSYVTNRHHLGDDPVHVAPDGGGGVWIRWDQLGLTVHIDLDEATQLRDQLTTIIDPEDGTA
jgi:hypothetical protein